MPVQSTVSQRFVYVSDLTKNVMYHRSYDLRMNTKGTEM